MPVVALADLRKHLNWPTAKGTEDDNELLAIAAGAEDTIEGYLGRPIRTGSVIERHSGGVEALLLRRNPCPCTTCYGVATYTITSVVEDGTTLASSGYTLDPGSGLLWRGSTARQTWTAITPASIVVTYTVTFASTPPWITMAVKRLVEHLWTRSQQARHNRVGGGGDVAESSPVPTFLLPYMVQSLLDPHRAAGF